MAEFTREQLIAEVNYNLEHCFCSEKTKRLMEIALAALTAEPDFIRYTCGTCGHDSLSHLHECPECHSRHIHTDALCLMPLLEGLK